jgi:helicase
MINNILSLWIAQSESWQTFKDFNLPEDSIARYSFLNRPEDFYISLFGELYDILENIQEKNGDMLSVAKGLEIFSLRGKSENFIGVNKPNNMIFVAGLYYLSNYSASAFILANLFNNIDYERDIDRFVHCFLRRNLDTKNPYCDLLNQYLNSGNERFIEELLQRISSRKEIVFKNNPHEFSIYYLAESIIYKFRSENVWSDLIKHNTIKYWDSYVKNTIKKSFPVWDFFPSQKIALEKGVLNSFQSIALQTPTSSGKTAICELIIFNEFNKNPDCKILYLAPFRALAAELKQSFGKNLSQLGISSKTIYGGNIPTASEKELIQNVTLLISTPEKFMALESSVKDFLKNFSLIICDEGHLLDDENRGLSYELLLSRLKKRTEINRKFVFISAIVPNIHQINEWLGGTAETVVESKYRPTEIEYGFLRPSHENNRSFHLDVNPLKEIPQKYILNKFLTDKDFNYSIRLKTKVKERVYNFSSFKTKSVAVALKALNSGSVALFSPTKGGKTGVLSLADELISQIEIGLKLPNPISFIKKESKIQSHLKEYFKIIFGENYLLTRLIDYGALFHTGDLPQYVREVIEDAIRNEDIKFIICTNTIAEGVNLPIRTIVINSIMRYDGTKQVPINLRDLKNLTGRAGRAAKETKGLVIVINPNDFQVMENVIKDVSIEAVNGYLYYIITRISKIITEKKLILTNEILDSQDDSFKELLDTIDISIIDLLGEEINPEELQKTIQELINETFVKFQASDTEIDTLNNLVNLRGEKIKPYIEKNEFKYIKRSGSNLRAYEEFQSELDLDNIFWKELNNPADDAWLKFLVEDKILNLSFIKFSLSNFNNRNKTKLTFEEIKSVIKSWIGGDWFQEISKFCNNDVNIALRLINSFIGYDIQSAATSIIRNVEMRFEIEQKKISETVLNFPQYLIYGLKRDLQLYLIEIGFNDRIAIIELSDLLETRNFMFNGLTSLNEYLRENKMELLTELQRKLPIISYNKTEESFNYLDYKNIN